MANELLALESRIRGWDDNQTVGTAVLEEITRRVIAGNPLLMAELGRQVRADGWASVTHQANVLANDIRGRLVEYIAEAENLRGPYPAIAPADPV